MNYHGFWSKEVNLSKKYYIRIFYDQSYFLQATCNRHQDIFEWKDTLSDKTQSEKTQKWKDTKVKRHKVISLPLKETQSYNFLGPLTVGTLLYQVLTKILIGLSFSSYYLLVSIRISIVKKVFKVSISVSVLWDKVPYPIIIF